MTEIVAVSNPYLPAMNVQIAIQRRNELVGFVKQIMVDGTDYGKIPGAGDKPTLLKPGAEKLTTFFGLSPSFRLAGSEEDWDGVNHNGEPFFYYRYSCELYRNGNMIASGEGSCNSHESKYRYRKGERLCPNCEAATIYKSKEPGKGFYCWTKKGGCGATFGEKDVRITGQEVGRVLNPDVADQVNTFQKMAQKRALIAATLLAVNASEFFTQDVEDMVDIPMAQYSVVDDNKKTTTPQELPKVDKTQLARLHVFGTKIYGDDWDEHRYRMVTEITGGEATSSNDLTPGECNELMLEILGQAAHGQNWPAKVEAACRQGKVKALRELSQDKVNSFITALENVIKEKAAGIATGK